MPEVRILSEIIANKIAAGEVVERPASVVKELIENSLDAGATRISIEIQKGGSDLIRVSDNGCGMSQEDALLSIERFATSKLTNDDDLFSIKTFGFRGEALPSIASVSQFTLITRNAESQSGTRVDINGGKIIDVSETGSPVGTMVDVKNLYFNTPARRKFLKTVNTEMGHIAYNVSAFALAYPHVNFSLVHNGRNVKHFSESDDLLSRVGMVLGLNGDESINDLYSLGSVERRGLGGESRNLAESGYSPDNKYLKEDEYSNQREICITGYITKPSVTRNSSNNILLFVNKRLISDRSLISAIVKGYQGRLMRGQFPMAALFIQIPFGEVDVNVHPAKLQVRFANQSLVFGSVVNAVHNALFYGENRNVSYNNEGNSKKIVSYEAHEYLPEFVKNKIDSPNFAIPKFDSIDSPSLFDYKIEKIIEDDFPKNVNLQEVIINKPIKEPVSKHIDIEEFKVKKTDPLYGLSPDLNLNENLSELHIIGQFANTYIIAESGNLEITNLNKLSHELRNTNRQLVLIDQHAAHERVLYERLKKRSKGFKPPSQDLIVPEIVEFNYKESALLETIVADLANVGIEIEHFGGTTFVVKSLPAIIDDKSIKQILRDIVALMVEGENMINSKDKPLHTLPNNSGLQDDETTLWLDKMLILMACHSAVRANHQLNPKEMDNLIAELQKCDNPYHCPHGRPIIISFTQKELEKRFKRI
ncbi:MAG: DNA mismatch repair endonuclease MutL [Desulfamplus sp.]|nr:DNA mismatch repair endonuclease MutL [Desulfamplus sp.]